MRQMLSRRMRCLEKMKMNSKEQDETRKMPDEGCKPRDEMSRRDEMKKWGGR